MLLLRNVSANLGTHNPSGQHFVAADRAAGWHDGLCPHTLPPPWPPPLHSIWVMHTHGLSWPVDSSVPLRAVPYSKRSWPQIPRYDWQADRWMVAARSPWVLASLPAFFSFSTPCLATQSQSWLYRLNTHKKLLCRAIHLPNRALSHVVNWL